MLLCERAGEQTRSEDASRALAVLRQVAERWPVDAPDRWIALMSLAAGWQLVGLGTLDAEALRATEDAYTDTLAVCPPRLRHFVEATRGYVREVRVRAGHLPDVPGDPVVHAGRQAAKALRQTMAEPVTSGQETGEDGAGELPSLGLTGVGSGGEDLQRVIERCEHTAAAPALRRLPLMLMAFFAPFLGELGIRPTAEEVRERIRAAMDALPEDDPVRASLHMVTGQAVMTEAGQTHDLERVEVALEHFDIALAMTDTDAGTDDAAEDAVLRGNREVWRVNALSFRAQVRGTQDALAEAAAALAVLRADQSVTAYTRVCAAVQHALIRARQAFAVHDVAGLAAAAADLRDARDRLPADDALRTRAAALLDALTSAQRFLAPGAEPPSEDIDIDRVRYASVPLPPADRAEARGLAGLALGLRVLEGREAGRIGDAIALLEEALAPPHPRADGGNRFRYAQALALLRLRRYRAGREETDLDEAVRWSETAVRLLTHPGHFGWAMAVMQLADAYRTAGLAGRGDPAAHFARSRAAGLRALRGHAWQVLLQSRAQYTTEALSLSAAHALTVARWCIADGCPDEAVRALDSGRGLVLHAASAAGTVPERLTAAGFPDLAAEWRTAAGPDDRAPAGDISGDLRYRALRVLAGTDGLASGTDDFASGTDDFTFGTDDRVSGTGDAISGPPADGAGTTGPPTLPGDLLTPPSLRDIATALRRTGADAMVYLVPGERTGSGPGGSAVTVHADGRTSLLHLAGLTADAPALTSYLGPGPTPADRDMGPADAGPPPSAGGRDIGRRTLEDLCDWASQAVLEPLLAHLRAEGATQPPRSCWCRWDTSPPYPGTRPADLRRAAGTGTPSRTPSSRMPLRPGCSARSSPASRFPATHRAWSSATRPGTCPTRAGRPPPCTPPSTAARRTWAGTSRARRAAPALRHRCSAGCGCAVCPRAGCCTWPVTPTYPGTRRPAPRGCISRAAPWPPNSSPSVPSTATGPAGWGWCRWPPAPPMSPGAATTRRSRCPRRSSWRGPGRCWARCGRCRTRPRRT